MRIYLFILLSSFLLICEVFSQSKYIEADSLTPKERKKHKSVMNASKEGNSYKLSFHLRFMNGASAKRVVSARSEGTTPLNEAAKGRHMNTIKTLLSYGADVNVPDEFENQTPLIISSIAGGSEINTLLIQKGADVNHIDIYKRSAIFYAIKYDYVGMVMELIKKGARVNDKDIEGVSPLELAKKSEFRRIQSVVFSARTKSLPPKGEEKKSKASIENKQTKKALARLKNSNKVNDQLRKWIAPSRFRVKNFPKIKDLIVRQNASVKISNNFDNSLLLQLSFLIRNIYRDRRGNFKRDKKDLFELLQIVVSRGGDPDRKNKRGFSARKIFDEWKGEDAETLKQIISGKEKGDEAKDGGVQKEEREDKKENVAEGPRTDEDNQGNGINEKEWKEKCLREGKGKRGSKNVCEDDWVLLSNCIREIKEADEDADLEEAQEACEQKAEETVNVEEVPELKIEKDSWFNKCLKRFEEKSDKLTEKQAEEGNKWCHRMFEEFEHCVSNSNSSKSNVEMNVNKCQDKIYAKEEKKFPPKKIEPEIEENGLVEEMISWRGNEDIEKTDLKKGDYIEIDLNSSFQYGKQVGWRTGWALKFKDIDKDCVPLKLRVRGLKIFGRVPDKFDKCEGSIFAYAIKKPKKVQSKVRRILLTSEKKDPPTIVMEVREGSTRGRFLNDLNIVNLKPGQSLKTLSFRVKSAKWKRMKFELQPRLKGMDKCFKRGESSGPWIYTGKNNRKKGEGLIEYKGGPVGYIHFEDVPAGFSGCEFSLKMTNLAGEFSAPFKIRLACPTCEKESMVSRKKSKFEELLNNKDLKKRIAIKKWRKSEKKRREGNKNESSPLNKEIKRYIDHSNWNPGKIKDLITKGASPNAKNRFGNTVLSMAVIKSRSTDTKELIKFLIESGGDPSIKNSKGFSAEMFANRSSDKSIKKFIEKTLNDPLVIVKRSLLGQWEDCYLDNRDKLLLVWKILPNSNLTVSYYAIDLKPGSKTCVGALKKKIQDTRFKMSQGSYRVSIPEPKDRVKDKEALFLDFDLKNSPKGPIKYFNTVKMGDEGLIFSLDSSKSYPINKDRRLMEIYERNRRVWRRSQ